MCVCVYIYIYIHTCIQTCYFWPQLLTQTFLVCLAKFMTSTHIYCVIYMYSCVYMHVCVHKYICIYIHIYTNLLFSTTTSNTDFSWMPCAVDDTFNETSTPSRSSLLLKHIFCNLYLWKYSYICIYTYKYMKTCTPWKSNLLWRNIVGAGYIFMYTYINIHIYICMHEYI